MLLPMKDILKTNLKRAADTCSVTARTTVRATLSLTVAGHKTSTGFVTVTTTSCIGESHHLRRLKIEYRGPAEETLRLGLVRGH